MAAPLRAARLRGPAVLIVLLCAFVSVYTVAQTVPISISPSPRALAPAFLQQRPTFEALVSRVRVDVIVTDDDGRFVEDLRPEDFLVYEDGELQQVLTAQLVDSGAGTVIDLPTAAGVAAAAVISPEEIRAGGVEAPGDRPRAGDLGALVFLIDGYGLDREARVRFSRGWNEILEATESFDVPRGAYLVDAAGSFNELAPLTYEVDTLRQVADEVRDMPAFDTSLETRLLELNAAMQTVFINEASGDSTGAETKAWAYEHDEMLRSIATMELLTTFCNALSARSGRTALVWVSTGVKLTFGGPYSALTGADSFGPIANMVPDDRILDRESTLHQAANSANVSIYAIDPTTPGARWRNGRTADSPNTATRGGGMEALQGREVRSAISALGDSLKNAANATGGQAYVMPSDLELVLRAVENDGRQYYMLTYSAPEPYGDSEYHEIHVEVLRPDVSVRARGGYVDLPEEERKDRMILAALTLPSMVTRMPVEAEAIRRWSQDGEPLLQMFVEFDASPKAEDTEAPRMEVHAIAADTSGDVVAEVHDELRFPEAPAAAADGSAAEPFVYAHDWALEPGDYELRIAVRDSGSGRLGATIVEIEVPDPSSGWHSSDLMVMAKAGRSEPRNVVGGRLREGDTVSVYAEVAGGSTPSISGRLFDAEAPGSPPVQLPAHFLQRDGAGIHRGSIGFRGLPAGVYSLEISIIDADADRQVNHSLRLEVFPN
jgi:VWFA-related protein